MAQTKKVKKKMPWQPVDAVAFREFLARVGEDHIREQLTCSAKVSASEVLTSSAEGLARIAAMKAGFDEALDQLFALAQQDVASRETSNFREM